MIRMHFRTLLAATALIALGIAPSGAIAQALTGAGATFPYPLYSKWFDAYHQKTGVEINYQSIGSGGGIQQVKAGTVDFGASDAALSNDRLKEMPRKIVHIPTVGGAVALVYNLPGFSGQVQLSPAAISAIYLGKITSWNDRAIAATNTGVTLPAAPILPVHRSDGSGTTNIFTMYLAAVSGPWKEMVGANTSVSWPSGVGGKGNEGVAGLVRQTPGAIGYVELAYAKQNRLPVVAVKNRAGNFISPSLESTTAAVAAAAQALAKDVRTPIVNSNGGGAYPISGLTYLLVYQNMKDPARAKQLAAFIDWAIHDGQSMAAPLDYAALPPAVVKVNEATLATLMANGHKIAAGEAPVTSGAH
jgi:phosphate transport system substrate-binding protein